MEQAKKQSILDAAVQAFGRLGFKKTSVDEIARDARVAKGTIYLACDSKEDLFYQSVHSELRAWQGELARRIDPRQPADELLTTIAQAGIVYLQKHPLVKDLFFGIYHGQFPGWASRFEELRNLGKAFIVEILNLGIRQGRFRVDLDVESTAAILQDLHIAGLMFMSRTTDAPAQWARRQAAGLSMVMDGLRAR